MFAGINMNRLLGGSKAGVSGAANKNGKRKAEVSPRKMEPGLKKRSALGDLTNAVKKKGTLGGAGKDKIEKIEKVLVKEVKIDAPKILTRARSKPHLPLEPPAAVGVTKKREAKQSTTTEKELATLREKLAEKATINSSKLPVRQTRSSRTRASEKNATEKENAIEVEVTKRVTRSSHTKLASIANSQDYSTTEDEDSSLYKTAVSTPESESPDVVAQNKKNQALADKQKLPDGVIDFDAETGNDPFQVGLYAEDIFAYYRRREGRFAINKYLDGTESQSELNRNMRSILVDWMVEVQESFELNHETMYLGVKLVDIFLSKTIVKREQLQLVGVTALYVAAKYDERCPPAIDDFCYICDDAYPPKEIIKMEMIILKSLNYDIGFPLSYRFLRRYSRCAQLDMDTLTLARYILEMSLLEYDFIDVKDSMIAASSLLLALVMKGVKNPWSKTLEYYSGYSKEEIFDLTHRVHAFLSTVPSHLKTIRSKYSHKVFYEAAKVPLPAELKL